MADQPELNIELLTRLCATPGMSGREDAVAALVRDELAGLVDEVSTDPLGNVVGVRRGQGGPRVLVTAHTDEIGFLVKHVDERGFLRLQPVGGFDPRKLPAQRVLVETLDGTFARGVIDIAGRPFITADPNALRPPKIDDLYVDLGRTADNVRASVEVGATVTLDRPVERLGDTVLGKAFDDRIGLLALLEALRALSGPTQAELIVVATTQEEVGLRGATTAGWAAAHDVALAVDITPAIDTPGALPEDAITRLGDGVGIKVMDPSTLPNRKLSAHLRQLARQRDIPHQLEILTRGGTDAAALQRARGGAPASTLSIPTRHAHTVNEMCAISDVQATIALLTAFFEHAHEGAYGYP